MTLGGRRVEVSRPRIRTVEDEHELPVATYEYFADPLGLYEGSTENATVARELLSDLVDRGLDPEQAVPFVTDGGKAIRRAIKDVFGEHALIHRCHRHKERNVCDLLPERDGR